MREIPDDVRARYVAEGWWSGESIGQMLDSGLAGTRTLSFTVHSESRPWTGTFADIELIARRLASGLRSRGVEPGDVVAFQLPNWMEAAATFWASSLLGAVVVPIVHIYGRREVEYILSVVEPAVSITAERFGRLVHEPDVAADVPIVGVVGRDFDDLLGDEPMVGTVPVDPEGPAFIAFTSGTTSAPKGVVHSHQTLWDPGRALALMQRDGLSVGGGPPHFMTIDADGCLTITDRKTDIIIRGGENISALELEEVLLRMPAVAEAAVIAVPDPRLGGHAAAVVRVREGHELPALDNVRSHFETCGVVRHKWPEQIAELADFPRAPSGRVQKHLIRRQNLFESQQMH